MKGGNLWNSPQIDSFAKAFAMDLYKNRLKMSKRSPYYIDMCAISNVVLLCFSVWILFSDFSVSGWIDLTLPPIDRSSKTIFIDPLFYGEITKSTPKKERLLNIVILSNDKIAYYVGLDKENSDTIEAKTPQIVEMISQHLHKSAPICKQDKEGKCWDPIFIIRPSPLSRYECFIWVLNAMEISDAKKWELFPKATLHVSLIV